MLLVDMPYKIIKEGRGWKVSDVKSGKVFSRAPMPKKQAIAQRVAIAISEAKQTKKPVGSFFA
jgi:hypothetical protein